MKNQFTNQNVYDAIAQYENDRPPTERLFQVGRCLAHFAVDDREVHVTPHLRGGETDFLPFNQGYDHGRGNPPAPPTSGKFATAYLWDEIWSPDSVLNLVQRFSHIFDERDEDGNKTGRQKIIFPRYHQLTAVRQLVDHTRQHGPGQRYLIQHSAGSGKTMTISWLAHQLSVLHDEQDRPIFDTIVIVSDRRALDRHLQQAVRDFEKTRGVVEAITRDSEQLRQALEAGKPIVVTTMQKFPVIAHKIDDLPGQRFAVIVDEAHSSQAGASTQAMHRALEAGSLAEAEAAEAGTPEDMEDVLVREMALRRHQPHISTFAFTATPKAKTLQLFDTPGPDAQIPFHLYPMRQAIEEGFIMDVLEHYTTYKSYWRLLKTIEDDPEYERKKAQRLLKNLVDLSPHAVDQKVAIIVEHFAQNVAHQIDGQAKAMIVTRSRLHAVRYKLAVDRYLEAHRYPFRSLVAFSGAVKDGDQSYTETGMNTASAGVRIPQSATEDTFKKNPNYRFLVVANKFQTGFDAPLLHTMYVDKKLGGVNAVQTLSRLNRIHPGKEGTMVLDFVNEADQIQKAFEPYYETTLLSAETDPNVLYDLQAELDGYHFYTEEEVDGFVATYFQGRREDLAALYALVDPVVDRVGAAPLEEQNEFRSQLDNFIRLYGFLAQILPFAETDWERRFHFYRFLLRHVLQRLLTRGDSELDPVGGGGYSAAPAEERDALSLIIEDINRAFSGEGVNGDAPVAIQHLLGKLVESIAVAKSLEANPPDTARLTFDQVTDQLFAEMVDNYFEFYKKVTDNPQAKQRLFDWLFEQYRSNTQE